MVNSKLHIAAIGYTKDDAEAVASLYAIPKNNCVSVQSVLQGGSRGRSFAGYILQMGFLPPRDFWQAFIPCLVGSSPLYTVRELEEMLEVAKIREANQAALFPSFYQENS